MRDLALFLPLMFTQVLIDTREKLYYLIEILVEVQVRSKTPIPSAAPIQPRRDSNRGTSENFTPRPPRSGAAGVSSGSRTGN
jgi:hypothetical protein